MRTIEIGDAKAPLSTFVTEACEAPVIVTKDGRPIAAVISLENADWETISLSTNPEFLAIIERSRVRHRKEGGVSAADVRKLFND